MSGEPAEIFVAVHVDRPQAKAIRMSIDGDDAKGVWIARKLLKSFHLTGKNTAGKDRDGNNVRLAHITIPEWLANREGMI